MNCQVADGLGVSAHQACPASASYIPARCEVIVAAAWNDFSWTESQWQVEFQIRHYELMLSIYQQEIGANKVRKELPNAVIDFCHKIIISYSYVISFVIYSDDVLYFCSTMKKTNQIII